MEMERLPDHLLGPCSAQLGQETLPDQARGHLDWMLRVKAY